MKKYLILTLLLLTVTISQKVIASEQNPILDRILKQASSSKARNVRLYACQTIEDKMKKDVGDLANLVSVMVGNMNVYTAQVVRYYDRKITSRGFFIADFQEFVDITNKNESSNKESLEKIQDYIKNISCADLSAKDNLKKFAEEMNRIINNLNLSKTKTKRIIQEIKDLEASNPATSSATSK